MARELYDWSSLTREEAASDLLGHLVRWGLRGDEVPTKTFRAIALTDGVEVGHMDAFGFGHQSRRLMFKARILGPRSPHLHIPDPCDPAYFQDTGYVYRLIQMHTWFASVHDTDRASPVTRGDIVMVQLEEVGAKQKKRYNLKYGKYLKLLSVEDPLPKQSERCAALIKLFGEISHTPLKTRKLGDPNAPLRSPPAPAAPAANLPPPSPTHGRIEHVEFFLKMRALLPRDKYSDEFIYGMMGNVAHESMFDAGISGDPECADATRLLHGRGLSGNTMYAAHGLFQMNTCGAGSLGRQMLEYYGFADAKQGDPATSAPRYAVLTNGDKQIEFVAWKLQQMGGTFTNTGAAAITEYTKWFLYEIENPANPESSRGSRTSHARGYASSIPAKMAAAQENKPAVCKGPASGGVEGTDYRWSSGPVLYGAWECIT